MTKQSLRTAVLLTGFGGPTSAEEIRPFVESVLRQAQDGRQIPEERLQKVLRSYEKIGGSSPYNAQIFKLRQALEKWIEKEGKELWVAVGFRHSKPSLRDAVIVLKRHGVEKIVSFILSPFRSRPSYERYQIALEEGRKKAGAEGISLVYTDDFHVKPLFVAACFERINETFKKIPPHETSQAHVLFSAHSIPAAMSDESKYASQFVESASLIAEKAALKDWGVAYQSRSGNPSEAWLEPDVKEAIRKIPKDKFKHVVLVPLGFLCENAEVLYDLDSEARRAAEELGLVYWRTAAPMDHPNFVEMVGRTVLCTL